MLWPNEVSASYQVIGPPTKFEPGRGSQRRVSSRRGSRTPGPGVRCFLKNQVELISDGANIES